MSSQTTYQRRISIFLMFLCVFVFLLYLCYLFPYTCDDWGWGTAPGIERLLNFFHNYNGRYMGNLLVIALTRSNLLKTVVMSLTLFGISFISHKLAGKNNPLTFAVFFFALLAIPRLVFRQAVVWTSGFSNYVAPVLLLLIYFYMIRNVAQDGNIGYKKHSALIAGLLGFTGALFMEHVTLYQVVIGILIIGYVFLKRRKVYTVHVSYFIGSLAGALLMFSNGAYRNVAQGTDNYRDIPDSSSGFANSAVEAFKIDIYNNGLFYNVILNTVLALFIIILVALYLKERKGVGVIRKAIVHLAAGVCIAYPLYTLMTLIYVGWTIVGPGTVDFECGFSIFMYLSLLVLTFLCIADKGRRLRMLFELISILILIVPLMFVHPIGGRCFFITYIFFALYLTELVAYLFDKKESRYLCITATKVFLTFSLCFAVYYISIFTKIHSENIRRIEYAHEQVKAGAEILIIPELPYNGYVWSSVPKKNTIWGEKFKDFYGIEKDLPYKNISYKEWLKQNQ